MLHVYTYLLGVRVLIELEAFALSVEISCTGLSRTRPLLRRLGLQLKVVMHLRLAEKPKYPHLHELQLPPKPTIMLWA